ncbi:GntR family transcriptional regulator [Bosea caraganae]|uniref:GntR family transcriptional regulator n=3 Tax=Bosea caraganae TaxID=2763117 RepID=A0A370KZY8_9HYPH|nr:GntR family transcriptional regulator [Bosea caraganae]RDJ20416.1 GntR family transcriptional regulator [Bosea caraganae]RDJ26603.1 GntR family transcriptional regulator [Bosea caraganae]
MALYGTVIDVNAAVKEDRVLATGNEKGSTALQLESELKRAIVAMELRPGTRLSEADIAERHGVSRQPAREALISLARTKLVQVLPQRGTVVAKISVSRMMQARFVREAVETAVVQRACASFDGGVRERITGLLAMQEHFALADDHASFQRYDEMFHAALCDGAGCPLAWEALRDIKSHMDRLCQLTIADRSAMLPLIEQHRAIMAAIDARDGERAAAEIRNHLAEILRTLPRIEAEHADLFE